MPKQNTPPAETPQAVRQAIAQLAQHIVIARKRRGETQAQWAKKLGVSLPTMARIERGDPAVAMASYVGCLWLINRAQGLAELIAPDRDHAALERELSRMRAPSARARPVRLQVAEPPPPAASAPAASARAPHPTAQGLADLLGPGGLPAT